MTVDAEAFEGQRLLACGDPPLLLDGRTFEEHQRMTIPGAPSVPNGERVREIGVLLGGDTRRMVIVHCAGDRPSVLRARLA